MTTQATPDFNTMLADQRKATETAQALADDYRLMVDQLRDKLATVERRELSVIHGRAQFREAFRKARQETRAARESLLNARKTNAALGEVIDDLNAQVFALRDEMITLRTDRDLLMSELGEANQAVTVMEGG